MNSVHLILWCNTDEVIYTMVEYGNIYVENIQVLCAGKPISVFYYYVTVRDDFVVHSRFFFFAEDTFLYPYSTARCIYTYCSRVMIRFYTFLSVDMWRRIDIVNFCRDWWSIYFGMNIWLFQCFSFVLNLYLLSLLRLISILNTIRTFHQSKTLSASCNKSLVFTNNNHQLRITDTNRTTLRVNFFNTRIFYALYSKLSLAVGSMCHKIGLSYATYQKLITFNIVNWITIECIEGTIDSHFFKKKTFQGKLHEKVRLIYLLRAFMGELKTVVGFKRIPYVFAAIITIEIHNFYFIPAQSPYSYVYFH